MLPTTMTEVKPDPAVVLGGVIDVTLGAGSDVGGATEKFLILDIAPKLLTVIGTVGVGERMSRYEMMAVRDPGVTNVVGRGEPFQLTTEPFTKFEPITVSVKLAGLQAGVEAIFVVDADTDEMAGVGAPLIAKVARDGGFGVGDVPPPGGGVSTSSWTVPAARKSLAGTVAMS